MVILRTRDFDVFQEAMHGLHGQILLRSRPDGFWGLRSVSLPDVTISIARSAASTIYTGRSESGAFHCIIPLSANEGTIVDGVRLGRRHVVWLVPGESTHIVRLAAARWIDICIAAPAVDRWLHGENNSPIHEVIAHNGTVSAMSYLAIMLRLAREAFHVERFLSDDDESMNIRSTLSSTLSDCLRDVFLNLFPNDVNCRTTGRHSDILEATLGLIDSSDASMPDTDVMCAVAHTTERTIRNVFNEFFGVSPHRYLMLRRLHSIRRSIRDGQAKESITSICARHNVWDFGRFSGQYRACFGVLPSMDLIDARQQSGNVVSLRHHWTLSQGSSETHRSVIRG